ncbi:MAG TPA: hypothetical protein GX515_13245 [Firmicutes bacterium]|nr:hypothetical protein [Bacillota bacterium]
MFPLLLKSEFFYHPLQVVVVHELLLVGVCVYQAPLAQARHEPYGTPGVVVDAVYDLIWKEDRDGMLFDGIPRLLRTARQVWVQRSLPLFQRLPVFHSRDAERPGRLTKGGKAARWALSRAVDMNPAVFGLYPITNWTAKALRAILAPFGVRLSL